jgi:3-deoxy-manno-octulosonate cytidylyltransferase (CMP-KDO synthetase)
VPAVPVRRLPFTLTETSVLAIIPARYQSTRFPGKPLVDIAGRSMIEHVYRRASEARAVDHVLVATDDARIASAVEAFGGVAVMTDVAHPSGTDRLAEVVATLPCSVVVNVQGDEPLIDPATIDAVVHPLLADPMLEMSTLSRAIGADELASPHVVKVVSDRDGFALYFSRAPIPYDRDASRGMGHDHRREAVPRGAGRDNAVARGHIGLYGYRRATLLRLAGLAPTPLETIERLEQLRALEHGIRIKVLETNSQPIGVDTPDDLDRIRQHLTTTSRA